MLKIVASMAHDGNILEYEATPHTGNADRPEDERSFWRRGAYEWAKDARGRWYLKRYEYQRSSTGSPKEVDTDFVLEVESFNPDPKIPENRFEFQSFDLPDGTLVEEFFGPVRRSYRVVRPMGGDK
jgi:hypothetical protein